MFYKLLYCPLFFLCLLPDLSGQDLSIHEWENRLLLILTEDTKDQQYQEQLAVLNAATAGLADRKLLLYTITPEAFRMGFNENANWIKSNSRFQQYHQARGPFEILLVGLDGGIKLRQSEILSTEKLFAIIDRMPMRRAELRRKKQHEQN